jgi:hypothetical protein
MNGMQAMMGMGGTVGMGGHPPLPPKVIVLETGLVGTLDYKIISADRADVLFQWLKEHKYQYSGDEATLNYYVQKKWIFTVMKIDTMQMKRNKDGSFAGEVTPTRFQFASEKLVYPLKITQISVRERTEALFYVQAPYKVDLEGEMTYQYTWVPMLQAASGCTPGGLPGKGGEWLAAFKNQIPPLLARARQLDFRFVSGQRPRPSRFGHVPTTMEWARKLSKEDIGILSGKSPYSETVPNVDEGLLPGQKLPPGALPGGAIPGGIGNQPPLGLGQFGGLAGGMQGMMGVDLKTAAIIQERLAKARKERPFGYLVRSAPAADVKNLQQLAGHLQENLFITKFRKTFARDEMNEDLLIVPARYNGAEDNSEYEEILPTSPP